MKNKKLTKLQINNASYSKDSKVNDASCWISQAITARDGGKSFLAAIAGKEYK